MMYHVLMKECEALLKRLMSHRHALIFSTPVDVVKFKIPDYFQVIKHPMDLGTIKNKITSSSYDSPWGFVSDVRLTFNNAKTYNPIGHYVHTMADDMSKFLEAKWKTIEKKLDAVDALAQREMEVLNPAAQSKKRTALPVALEVILPDTINTKWTEKEKGILVDRLKSINLMSVPFNEFFREHSSFSDQTSEDPEAVVYSLSDEILSQLRKLLDDYSTGKQSGHQAEYESCRVANLIESGLSDPSIPHCKGNERTEEYADNDKDPCILNYPSLVTEKDTGLGNRNSSSSSSSNSDSRKDTGPGNSNSRSSSSSSSDSGSSSSGSSS